MRYANVIYNDVVNSKGTSLTFYCQGCTHHCKNCFNKSTWDFKGGKQFNEDVLNEMMYVVKMFKSGYDNLVLLGGEPFDNIGVCLMIANAFKEKFQDKSIWIYSGYTYEEIQKDENKLNLLQLCDVLVDGKFIEELKDTRLKFRGSKNQRIILVKESLRQNKIIEKEDLK